MSPSDQEDTMETTNGDGNWGRWGATTSAAR